jgi:hypothetical protein
MGIYKITCVTDNDERVYIGQTVDFEKRRRTHFRDARRGKHGNYKLQRYFDYWGEGSFIFEPIISVLNVDDLTAFEQAAMDAYRLAGFNVMNAMRAATPRRGRRSVDERPARAPEAASKEPRVKRAVKPVVNKRARNANPMSSPISVTHDGVSTEYGSIKVALVELGLYLDSHQKMVREALKAKGKLTYNVGRKSYAFALIPQSAG